MKRYIRASEVPTRDQYFSEVLDEDMDVLEQLMSIRSNFWGPLIKLPSTRNDLGRTDNYDLEDKCIHLVKDAEDHREYDIPFARNPGRGGVLLYTSRLSIYDDKSFQFGKGKIRRFGEVSDSTIYNDFDRAGTRMMRTR